VTGRYVLTYQAWQDLASIATFIESDSGPEVVEQVLVELRAAFRLLAERPGIGHVRTDLTSDRSVRFWVVHPHLIAFVPRKRTIEVVTVVHGSREPRTIARHLRSAREGWVDVSEAPTEPSGPNGG